MSFPTFTNPATFELALTCFTCIRSGFEHCSKSGMYKSGSAADLTAMSMTCCDPAAKPFTNLNCANGYTSVAGVKQDSAVCTSDYVALDYSLVACPQDNAKCGNSNFLQFENKSAIKQTVTLTGLTHTEKCSWLIKASKDAPGFKIKSTSTMSDSALDLHYIEYSSSSSMTYGTEFINGLIPRNIPLGKFYD